MRNKFFRIGLVLIGGLTFTYAGRLFLHHRIGPPLPEWVNQSRHVKILRDNLGVPHIFGDSDSDTAFGLAYAHAEDNWPTIQGAILAARGKLSLLKLSKTALMNDYLVQLLGVWKEVDANYHSKLSPEVRQVLEGYAAGMNYYAALHPYETDSRFLPFKAVDIAATFVHKMPLFEGLPKVLKRITNAGVSTEIEASHTFSSPYLRGSNAHAVSSARSSDGITRLNINAHQPWEGPVAWYEAHLVSKNGWNMTGATFPGAAFILAGHNNYLGWAHTVNRPKLIDVYKLEMDSTEKKYRFDNEWKDLEIFDANLKIETGFFELPFSKKAYRSIHGPVLRTNEGFFAFRYAGMGTHLSAAEQWYRMNKATQFEEWKNAMKISGVPMFNTVYADAKNIYYVYNASLPIRHYEKSSGVLPGNRSQYLWTEYLPFDRLPSVLNPTSGFLQNCNSSPFQTTAGADNPNASEYSSSFEIEPKMTNRAIRSLELLSGDKKISRNDFISMKFDQYYSKASALYRDVIQFLVEKYVPADRREQEGLTLLKKWDGHANSESQGAALGVLTLEPIASHRELGTANVSPQEAFKTALQFLDDTYHTIDPPLGSIQRVQRGSVDLPIDGAPDVLNAVYANRQNEKFVGYDGDSFVLIVEFPAEGARSFALNVYGSSNHSDSKHYADQAAHYSARKLRRTLRTEQEIRAQLEREYHPGE